MSETPEIKFSLDAIERGITKEPIRALIYGANGVGKTTVSSDFPDPIFMDLEDGVKSILDTSRVAINSWDEATAFVKFLASEEHPYKTLIIDSLDQLEKYSYAPVCDLAGVDNINGGYGKGLVTLATLFEGFKDQLHRLSESKGMHIILIAHEKAKKIERVGQVTYDLSVPSTHERISSIFLDHCNIVGHVHQLLGIASKKGVSMNKIQTTVKVQVDERARALLRICNPEGEEIQAVAKNRFNFIHDKGSIPFTANAMLKQWERYFETKTQSKGAV